MSGPEDGKYLIQLAIYPRPSIGADYGPGPVEPVITEGQDDIWTVKKLEDGNYTLTPKQTARFQLSQDGDDKIVVGVMPPAGTWSIQRQEGASYTIEAPSPIIPKRAWTVDSPEPKSPVLLKMLANTDPLPNQLWNFVPLYEWGWPLEQVC